MLRRTKRDSGFYSSWITELKRTTNLKTILGKSSKLTKFDIPMLSNDYIFVKIFSHPTAGTFFLRFLRSIQNAEINNVVLSITTI